MHTREMIRHIRMCVNQALIEAIDTAHACAQTCSSCADACLDEEMVAKLPSAFASILRHGVPRLRCRT